MIKYNDDNIYVGEIKQLLKNFNLPKAIIYKDDCKLVPNLHYIKNNGIYYCNKYGQLEFIDNYVVGDRYGNLTTNMKITSNVYDSYVHKYLGRYLRFMKDYYGLDLMSMYNCFSNELFKTTFTIGGVEFDYEDEAYSIYCVPVRFGEKYTIGVNCPLPIRVVACTYRDGRLINDGGSYESTLDTIRYCSLTKPYLYDKLYSYNATNTDYMNAECLCLLIKVPSSCDSSIVVLEGDYIKSKDVIFSDRQKLVGGLLKYCQSHQTWEYPETHSGKTYETIDSFPTWFGDYDYNSKLELLSHENSKGNNLVATRLEEYLCGNAITNISEGYDIKKLQKLLISKGYVDSDYLGMWSEKDRKGLYRLINDLDINNNYFDVISYLDKDVEYKIGGIE